MSEENRPAAASDDEQRPRSPDELVGYVRNVLEAAEATANRLVDDARAEGERRIGEAKQRAQTLVDERRDRMRELSDDLVRQAEAIESRLTAHDEALDGAIEGLRRELERLPDVETDERGNGARA